MQDFTKKLILILKGEFLTNAPLKNYTTLHIGGPADYVIFPKDIEDLQNLINFLSNNKMPFIIIGNGSNLLFKDEGYRGAVICLKRYFNTIKVIDETKIEVDAGVILPLLSKTAYENSLSGLEFAVSIPGTIGGAVHNNAGAFGQGIENILEEIEVITKENEIKKIQKNELNFSYRKCNIPLLWIITKAKLLLTKNSKDLILKKMNENVENRNKKQPYNYPSAGSIYKNPKENFAGKIIENLELKGKKIGGAQISEKHANFIVNIGGAKASDFIELMELIEKTAFEKLNIKLEREIEVVGS